MTKNTGFFTVCCSRISGYLRIFLKCKTRFFTRLFKMTYDKKYNNTHFIIFYKTNTK